MSSPSPLSETASWHSTRYRVECELGRGGMGVVYQAFDRLTRRTVALKRIEFIDAPDAGPAASGRQRSHTIVQGPWPPMHDTPVISMAATEPSPSSKSGRAGEQLRLALAHEFRILSSLRHPHIISVLDYGFDNKGRPYIAMDMVEGAVPLTEAAARVGIDERIVLVSQLIRALQYLHRMGVIHRDLKPDNVLVTDIDGRPSIKVVDFGLAISARAESAETGPAGTIAYMAPEVLLGAPPTVAADLYSLGVMMYEVFAGEHPFQNFSAQEMLTAVRRADYDVTALELPPASQQLIGGLMSANPSHRPSSAAAALSTWRPEAERSTAVRSADTPDGFLRAARFVGREDELNKLVAGLGRAKRSRGSAWLIHGVSGVGKSRLLEELRAAAMVRGILVLNGQALDGGHRSFAVWRDVLREVAVHTSLFPLEASVLKGLVHDLDEVLEAPVAAAPTLDRDGNLRRLSSTVKAIFNRLNIPTLLILEDLHWATPESIALLKRLVAGIGKRRLMVVGSLRSDERPSWLSTLDAAREIQLEPLRHSQIDALCQAILGDQLLGDGLAGEGQNSSQFVEPIRKASGGNPFFVVELLRRLSEESGGLAGAVRDLSDAADLTPEKLLRRRLKRVPDEARAALELAAVAGRQLDLSVLRREVNNLDDWLQVCAAASVLEVVDDRWRFRHDKLRETLLEQLVDERKRALHRRVAAAQAGVYGNTTHAAVMAYHLEQAGDIARAVPHLVAAAEKCLRQGAFHDADDLARRVISYQGEVSLSLVHMARARRVLVETNHALAKTSAAISHLESLLEVLDLAEKNATRPWQRIAGQLVIAPRNSPIDVEQSGYPEELWRTVLETVAIGLRVHMWLGNLQEASYLLLLAHNLSRSLGRVDKMAVCRCAAAYALSMTPARALGKKVLRDAGALIEEHGDDRSVQMLTEARGLIAINQGQWRSGIRHMAALERLSTQMGDERGQLFAALQVTLALQARGQLDECQAKLDTVELLASSSDDHQLRALAMGRRGWLALFRGAFDDATQAFEQALDESSLEMVTITLGGGLALAQWALGRQERATGQAQTTLARMLGFRTSGHAGLYTVPAVATVLLAAAHQDAATTRAATAHDALAYLKRFQRRFPMGAPSYHLLAGRHARWGGKTRKARRHYQRSIRAAEALRMPIDAAAASAELGHSTLANVVERAGAAAAVQQIVGLGAYGCLQLLDLPASVVDDATRRPH